MGVDGQVGSEWYWHEPWQQWVIQAAEESPHEGEVYVRFVNLPSVVLAAQEGSLHRRPHTAAEPPCGGLGHGGRCRWCQLTATAV